MKILSLVEVVHPSLIGNDFDGTVLANNIPFVWWLLMTSLLLTVAYVANAVYLSQGVPVSVSAHVYESDMSQRWYYTAWMWLLSLTFAPALFLLTPYELDWAPHVLVTSLLLTSVLPLIERDGHEWHRAATILSAATCSLCVYIVYPVWLLLWVVSVALGMYHSSRMPFIVQTTCVASLLGSLISKMVILT